MLIGKGFTDRCLTEQEMRELCGQGLARVNIRGKRVLVIIPDNTRTAPVPFFFSLLHEMIGREAKRLDFLIALGTHAPMSQAAINKLLGVTEEERKSKYADVRIFNHRWDLQSHLKTIGVISADEIEKITGGLMREDVRVQCNKRVFNYDQLIIVGPTFPHEVVGFSGGNKYFFPGISGPEVLNFFHWLGAVITNPVINGTKFTPVRSVIDRAAAMIQVPKLCLSLVATYDGVKGLYIASPEEAYNAAADLSAKVHIVWVDKPYQRILSCAPPMYDELWTAGKCMYKMEPVVADGGELIIYAPHVTEVSATHGKVLKRIGYHVRDYFLKRMEHFKDVPRGVMAHSTHVKGIGTFENGVEKPRITVTLATGISKEICQQINLGYMDPATIDPEKWKGRESEGILCVPKAGEMLYRLSDGTVPRIPGDPGT